MNVDIPMIPENEERLLMKLIASNSLFMDITFPEYPVPLTSLDLEFREAIGMETTIRKAVPQEIPRIREFFDTLKLIEEGMVNNDADDGTNVNYTKSIKIRKR
jgi:hypothetical protein